MSGAVLGLGQPLLIWALAVAGLPLLLLVGTALGRGLGVHRWGIPEALLAGVVGLLLGPQGPWPLLPEDVMRLWEGLPLILLTLVFGSLLVGKPLPQPGGLWRPLRAQVLLSLTLAFGQYLVGGLAVLLVLQPWLGVSPVMACLIEVAYEGGHGSAAAMAPTYAQLGVEGAEALGLALATVGLVASTLVGGLLVVVARWRGWVAAPVAP
jgi:ESS family glutamate:Na+ symporter